MSPVASYSFLPWLRQGVANTIASADGDATVKTRAAIHVALRLAGDPVAGGGQLVRDMAQDIALYGPGDIVGIDSRAVVRTEPRNWITNFESNYLPAVDFYDEDFPWRYTPAAADSAGLRLRPWIALVVLHEGEFEEGKNASNRPLPYVTVADAGLFPPTDQLWAWAHVHFNQPLSAGPDELVSPDMTAVLPRVRTILEQNPDSAYSRIICPRRLAENAAYHAFVVPTFETGRLAGLGQDPSGAPHATFSAWDAYPGKLEATNHPVYYRWFFRTGTRGDFEYLVSILKPRPVDKRVGVRDMDVHDPGSNLAGITDPALGGILRLGGALQVPDADLGPEDLAERQKYENWDQPYPDPFQRALAAFIDLPDDYAAQDAAAANAASGLGPGVADDPDPLITPPLYGRWQALTQRLLTNRDGTPAPNDADWVHRLNLDPRFRVPASYGAEVVEANAEAYMNHAWQQVGDVLAANQRIRRLHLASEVSSRWFEQHLTPLAQANPERALSIAAPVFGRIVVGGSTVSHTQATSLVAPVLTSTAMRRTVRPGARVMGALRFDGTATPLNLLARVNAGEVSGAPPELVPPGVPTVDQAAAAAAPKGVPPSVLELLARFSWLPWAVLVLAVVVALGLVVLALLGLVPIVAALVIAVFLVAVSIVLYRLLRASQVAGARAESISEAGQSPSSVDSLPKSPDFVLSQPGSGLRPTSGPGDSPTAVRFKSALRDSYVLVAASKVVGQRPEQAVLDLPSLTTSVVAAVDPAVTIPRRGLSVVGVPPWIRALMGDSFGEVMAYPKIDLPMYEPLKAISIELFLPNVNLIPDNSITLIETNQRFIESYLVGLNHEFARKLLWREYPTDQRGSYFRQFWDVRSYIDGRGLSQEVLKEKLYDIPELHSWPSASSLGDHNNRASPGQARAQAVLVIRGELLKKYPTAVIYAHRAQWARNEDGSIDLLQPRSLVELSAAEEQNPPSNKLRSPLYEAKADPDIYFFGFDLTIVQVRGQPGDNPADDPGWFFVIKERPGEPRFGLEISRAGALEVFDQLTWDDAIPGATPGQFLSATSLEAVALGDLPAGDVEGKKPQHDDDVKVDAAAASSARWAYLLLRSPVMVAIHADEMLGTNGA